MEFPKNYAQKFVFAGSPKQITEYSDLISQMAKLAKQPYIAMHKRIERTFAPSLPPGAVLSNLRRWIHEASKASNGGLIINARMKQYRDALTKS